MKPDYEYWNRLDRWPLDAAILLLLNIDPGHEDARGIMRIVNESHQGRTVEIEPRFKQAPLNDNLVRAMEYLDFAWASHATGKLYIRGIGDIHADPWVTPEDWLTWAASKRIGFPPGLAQGEAQVLNWDGFDPSDETYPRELDIAFQAWRHAINNQQSGKSPKQIVLSFLQKNYRDLSADATDRIATVCNWNKKGGAPRK